MLIIQWQWSTLHAAAQATSRNPTGAVRARCSCKETQTVRAVLTTNRCSCYRAGWKCIHGPQLPIPAVLEILIAVVLRVSDDHSHDMVEYWVRYYGVFCFRWPTVLSLRWRGHYEHV